MGEKECLCDEYSHSDLLTGDSIGLKAIAETIDNRNDFKTFMQNFTVARGSQRGPSRNVPYDDGSVRCGSFHR